MRGNDGDRNHAIGVLTENIRIKHVEGAAGSAPDFFLFDMRRQQSQTGVEHRHVEADIIQSFIEELG